MLQPAAVADVSTGGDVAAPALASTGADAKATLRENAKKKMYEMRELLQQHGKAIERCESEQGAAARADQVEITVAEAIPAGRIEPDQHQQSEGLLEDFAKMFQQTAIVYGSQQDTFWVVTSSIMLAITYLLVLALAAIVCWQFIMYEYQRHVVAWVIGAVFVMMSLPLALQDIHFHIIHYVSPLQRHYIRILWMIPIYAVESWLALRFNKQKIYLETMREAYEAYVVYSFFKLMREFLGDKPRAISRLKAIQERTGRKTTKMLFPCCCLKAWRLDAQFLTRSALGVYQYVVLRTTCAMVGLVLEQWHLFGEGHYDLGHFYVYYVVIVNCSQCWALWCLVLFYHEFREDLRPIWPLPKFLVIKAIVFVSWWQGIIIMYMAHEEMIHPVLDYSSEDVGKGLLNLLICAQMLVYGLFFHYVFSFKDFRTGGPLAEWLEEQKAVMKKPEEALNEMMPIDVFEEGKGYVERVPKYVMRNMPEGVKSLPDHLPAVPKITIPHLPSGLPHLPNPLMMGRTSAEKEKPPHIAVDAHIGDAPIDNIAQSACHDTAGLSMDAMQRLIKVTPHQSPRQAASTTVTPANLGNV